MATSNCGGRGSEMKAEVLNWPTNGLFAGARSNCVSTIHIIKVPSWSIVVMCRIATQHFDEFELVVAFATIYSNACAI